MKNYLMYLMIGIGLAQSACRSHHTPNLGKVVDGYLVNVDDKGVILQGYDPVSFRNGKSVHGDSTITYKYHGAMYYFVSDENKTTFISNAKEYEPEFGGYCAYGVAVKHLSPIEVWTFDTTFMNKNIFNHNAKAVAGWQKDIPGNWNKALVQWEVFKNQYTKSSN